MIVASQMRYMPRTGQDHGFCTILAAIMNSGFVIVASMLLVS
jgi:hypothetical protein